MEITPQNLVRHLISELNADILLYSAAINNDNADKLIGTIRQIKDHKSTVILILSTFGGDPNAAYRITRFLKHKYKKFILFVFGYCKSAGTLIAIGADEIVMSCLAELGPLDIQIYKEDNFKASSGLDLKQALDELSDRVFDIFETCFLQTIYKGGGIISTKTAADIASSIAVGLLSPITAQIDPLRLGDNSRSIKIGYEYGIRLNSQKEQVIEQLVSGYPSHGFVIDYSEAKNLFGKDAKGKDIVREPTPMEDLLENMLYQSVRSPDNDTVILNLADLLNMESTNGDGENGGNTNDEINEIESENDHHETISTIRNSKTET